MSIRTILRDAPAFALLAAAVCSPASAQVVPTERLLRDLMLGGTPGSGAQQAQGELNLQRPPSYEWMRLSGAWTTPFGRLMLEHRYFGRMTGRLTPANGAAGHDIVIDVDADGATALGVWSSRDPAMRDLPPFKVQLVGDGGTLEFRYPGARPAHHPQVWSAAREAAASASTSRWVGDWETTLGRMTVRAEGAHLLGTIAGGNHPTGRISPRVIAFADIASRPGKSGGAWRDVSTLEQGLLLWQMSADGSTFTGTYTRPVNGFDVEAAWSGSRVGGGNGFERTPAIPGGLLARYEGDWKTQSGTMRIARQGAGATMTMLGPTGQVVAVAPLAVSAAGDTLDVELAGWPEPGSRRARLILTTDGADFEARELTGTSAPGRILWSGYSEARRRATVPATPPPAAGNPPASTPPSGTPLAQLPAPHGPDPAPTSGAFKPLKRVDVRLDRVVVARGYPTHQVHAFVTVRNTSPTLQYFTSGFLKALLTDADGVSLERSQPYRASGEPAQLFAATPVVQPGGELSVRYVFTPPEDARLTSLTLSEGETRAEFVVAL